MDKAMEESVRRVQELLGAHAQKKEHATSRSGDGLVTATVDASLQLTSVKLHDKSIDEARGAELERAIVEAVNAARINAVKAAGESLLTLRDSTEWESAVAQIFRRGGTVT